MASAISLYPYTFGWMPSAQNKVIVLDHGHVVQTHSVVGSASVLYCNLVEDPESRCCLAGVKKLCVSTCKLLDISCR